MEKEERTRIERIEKAKKLSKGFELMKLCKEAIENEGEMW